MNTSPPSFSFIVPALNEENNLPAVIDEITDNAQQAGVSDYEIIIVDDGSSDGTGTAAERLCALNANITYIRNDARQGVGLSFLTGAHRAIKEFCLIVPGDNEFILDFFPQAVSLLASGTPDFIVTYVDNPWIRPLHRRIISTLYINILNLLFSTDFKYTNGIVIYPSAWIHSLELNSKGYTFQSEALLRAHWEGKRFIHVGMTLRPRKYGKSKIFSIMAIMEVFHSLIKIKLARKHDLSNL